jgi:Asp/Glu/hydantoin racemase
MRIWHQSLTELDKLPGYADALWNHFAAIAPNATVDVHGVKAGTYPSRYPGRHIASPYLQGLQREQFVRAALAAEGEGYDALMIATIPDLAREECRSVVDLPIVGFGQASLLAAGFLGDKVGVVSFDGSGLEPQLRRNADKYGLSERMGPVVTITATFDDIIDALSGTKSPEPVVEAFMVGAEAAIGRGADVLIPGAGPLNLLVARLGLSRVGEVPVVDSFHCAIEACQMLVSFRGRNVTPTRNGFFWRRAVDGDVRTARELYGLS